MKGYLHAVLPSCSKVVDFIEDHPSEIGKYCKIDSLTFYTWEGLQYFKIFYDGAGNPIELRELHGPGDRLDTATLPNGQLSEEGRPVKFMYHTTEPYDIPYNYEVSYDRKGNRVIAGLTF